MTMQVVATKHAPAAIGPYSQALKAGDFLFCSGQIPLDRETMELVAGGIEQQTRQVLKNLEEVLKAGGCGFANLVKTTIFLTDMQDFTRVNALYGECFGDNPPARATVQVAGLPKGALVEIEAVAYLGS